jgi:FERM/RhoGEF/pleckstrin domain protein 2
LEGFVEVEAEVGEDDPLASLPLLGYSVNTPSPADEINKDYVFKLQFKNHVYFFRAESQFTFDRWMEVLSSATQAPGGLDDQLPLNGDV